MIYLNIFTYLAVIIFLVSTVSKLLKIASAPMHLRWELYPVPSEYGKASYGGSRLEEVDWWTKKHKKNIIGEIFAMLVEIFTLKGVKDNNKRLWTATFPFHIALYFLIVNIFFFILLNVTYIVILKFYFTPSVFLIFLSILFKIADTFKYYIIAITTFGLFGAIKLYYLRLKDIGMKNFSTPSHYFNIIFIGLMYLSLLIWALIDDRLLFHFFAYYFQLITFIEVSQLPLIGYIHITLSLLFIIYMPFTFLIHFFAKYFTYHKVRWDDEPNLNNNKMKNKVAVLLNQVVTWSAPHIGADGKKTWIAIVSASPNIKEK